MPPPASEPRMRCFPRPRKEACPWRLALRMKKPALLFSRAGGEEQSVEPVDGHTIPLAKPRAVVSPASRNPGSNKLIQAMRTSSRPSQKETSVFASVWGGIGVQDLRSSVTFSIFTVLDRSNELVRISRGNGSSLEALLSWGVEVKAAISPLGACLPQPAAPTPGRPGELRP